MEKNKFSETCMLRALAISKLALPACEPNPPVGCVLAKDGQIVSEGYTQAIGGNHAEVEALNAYGGLMNGVTAYTTLEPCSFVGRTPSCAETLVRLGVKHVVIALLDPDIRNNGKGVELLERAGVAVDVGLLQKEVEAFLKNYLGKS